jgi:putative flippase GtrA
MKRQIPCGDGRPRKPALSEVEGSKPSEARQSLFRWLKFNFVGGVGIAVQLAALTLFRSALHLDYLVATALAVEAAVLHNFLWHERFTWTDRPPQRFAHTLSRLAKFNTSNGLVSLAGNLLIMRALVGQFHMNYVIANLIAVATCSIVNFLLSDRFVFEA